MIMRPKGKLHSEVKGNLGIENHAIGSMVKSLLQTFVSSGVDYCAITDIKADLNIVCEALNDYASREKIDVCMLKLEDRILLSKPHACFEKVYNAVKKQSSLEVRKGIVEVWDDTDNKVLHVFVIPLKRHFLIEYLTILQKKDLVSQILSKI